MTLITRRQVSNVVSTHKTSSWTSALNGNWQDVTGLSVSITPKRSTSNVLVVATVLASTTVTAPSMIGGRVWRNSSATVLPFVASSTQQSGNTNWHLLRIEYLDSPSTTSSTTYQFQLYGSNGATNYTYVNIRGDGTVTATSSITATEVFV